MTDFLICAAIICLLLESRSEAIKRSVYGLVPVTPIERLLERFMSLQLWFALGFALLAVLSVLE